MFLLHKLVLQVVKQRQRLVFPGNVLVLVQELMLEKLRRVHLLLELVRNLEFQ